jgi:serine/threonine protein kinase
MVAVQYLHSRNICHRDLKPENILLESRSPFSRVFLADFGMSKIADNLTTQCGTLHYLAPEVLVSSGKYTKQVDCWSVGVTLYTTIEGQLPFLAQIGNDGEEVDSSLVNAILQGRLNFRSSGKWNCTSREIRSVIRYFWSC